MHEQGAVISRKEHAKRTAFRWFVLAMIFTVYMIAGADRANIGVVMPYIKKDFGLSNTDIGAMASLFYIGYAIIQIPSGYFYEKYGVKKLFGLAMLLTSAATYFIGTATSAFGLKAGRVLLGVAEGPIPIAMLTTINRWFPPSEKGTATGVYMSSIKFAPAVVPPLCALIISTLGWREVFYLFAIPGFFITAAWWWLVNDKPENSRFVSKSELDHIQSVKSAEVVQTVARKTNPSLKWIDKVIRTKNPDLLDTNKKVLKSWDIWACSIGYFLMVGIVYAIMTWVPTYLVTVKKYAIIKMGFVAAAPWVGAIIGNLVGGYLSDNFFEKRRKPMMLVTTLATTGMMYALIYTPNDPYLLALMLAAAGILLNLGYSTFLVYPMGITTKEKCPLGTSVVNFWGALGGAFTPFVVGVILDNYRWDAVFAFLSASSFITFIILFTMIEPIEGYQAETS
jgi:MFS transporter, ACS family, glucarate transporter